MLDFTTIEQARGAFRQLYNQVQSIFKWDLKGNRLQNIAPAVNDTDAVNLKQVNDSISLATKTSASPGSITQKIAQLIISNSFNPALDDSVDIGTAALQFKTVYAYVLSIATNAIFSNLTASLPLKLNASQETISEAIKLDTTEVQNILALANGGTNSGTAAGARTSLNAANATTFTCTITTPLTGTITGTANLTTGAVTGTCTITAGVIKVTLTP